MIIFLLFTLLLLLGVPVVIAFLVPCMVVFFSSPDLPFQLVSPRLINAFFSSSMVVVPLFIFAAQLLIDLEISDSIFNFVNKVVGHVRGGLAYVNVLGSIIFAGMTGSEKADAAGLGKVEIKAMNEQGYPLAFSGAVTAASAMIGPIIPPSVGMVVYGALADVSVGKLLIGGILPGLLMAITQMIYISLVAKRRGFPTSKFAGVKQIWESFTKAFPGLLIPGILIGGMLCGIFTPTEAAAVAVVYAMIIGFCLKRLTFRKLWRAFKQSALDSAVILIIFAGATLVTIIVTRLQVTDSLINFMTGIITNQWMFLGMVNIFLLIVGCFMGGLSALTLLVPILAPLAQAYGINPVHFGVVMVLNIQIGQLTPPMGGTLFIICKVAELKLMDLLKELWPFLCTLIIALIMVTFIPQMVTWIPNLLIQ